ncbi:PAS domain S-box protein [Gloeocapsopsis sp. IPPAS B-1203]|uniref:PAS domain S-box protein n=1 Tax=Gloeocapsopsis sp. IPPAS B-1203 TaxID=2049454 RepID=UPI000C1A4098|nr:PAS domain S-box protein [Gloeocapsopsis sp. IPPAS B-1203]PIG91024.1 histidine kinase [Gloeocapsopsis sp. IPPAS B-1203]
MTGKAAKFPGKFRLRTTLVVPFVLQIIAAFGLVGWIAYRSGQQAVNDVASQLRAELTHRITERLESYVEIPKAINRLNATAFAQGDINVSNPKGEHLFWQQMQIYPTLSFVYCGDEQGGFFGVRRFAEQDSTEVVLQLSNSDTNFIRQGFGFDGRGNRTVSMGNFDKPFDPRVRPWYQAAQATGGEVWSEIYLAFSTLFPTVTASTPVYDQANTLIGVCATDVFLPQLSIFLQNLEFGKTGSAFIMERSGRLVATSSVESMVTGEGEKSERLLATASTNSIIRATAEDLNRRFSNLNEIQSVQQLDFNLNRERQYIQVVPFQDSNLDWLVVLTIPESDFMAQINASRRNALLLSLGTLASAIAIGIFTSRWVTKPIYRVSHASDKLAQGELNQYVKPSPISELDTLASSFNTMAKQLKESFDALRQSEATNRAIVTAIPDLMIRAKGDGTYLEIIGSDRLRGVHGVRQFSPGRTVQESLPPDLANQRMHYIQQALTTGELQIYEQRITINDQAQDEEVRILVLGDDEVLIMVRDITDRKSSEESLRIAEENYRSIFENALEGIFQSSPEGRFINVNPALAKIYGYDSPSEMLESITDIGTQLYVDPEKRFEFKTLLEKQDAAMDFEYRCYCKDGSIIWIQIDARAVKDNRGKVLYYEGIVQDITDRKRREDELRRQLEELRIEIDQKTREKEVAMLTESSYFQEVQQEIAEVNLDEFWG